jgi:hypothetical protein
MDVHRVSVRLFLFGGPEIPMTRNGSRRAANAAGTSVGAENTTEINPHPDIAQVTFPVDRVHVGERTRRDMGDIAGLAASIEDVMTPRTASRRFRR